MNKTKEDIRLELAQQNALGFFIVFDDTPMDYQAIIGTLKRGEELPEDCVIWEPFENYNSDSLAQVIEDHVSYLLTLFAEYDAAISSLAVQ